MIDSLFPNGMARYLIGGALIGLAIATLYLTTGRQGGVSTFFSSIWSYFLRAPAFRQPALVASRHWRLVFTLGLVLGGALYVVLGLPHLPTAVPAWKLGLGGVLVGFGTRLGGGCTSGHGICGMTSLSAGSLGVVLVFLLTGMATASILAATGL